MRNVFGTVLSIGEGRKIIPSPGTGYKPAYGGYPGVVLRHHVTGAVERGEAVPVVEVKPQPARNTFRAKGAAPVRGADGKFAKRAPVRDEDRLYVVEEKATYEWYAVFVGGSRFNQGRDSRFTHADALRFKEYREREMPGTYRVRLA